jgi:hypothetical protein
MSFLPTCIRSAWVVRLAVDGTLQVIAPSPQISLLTVSSRALTIRFQTTVGLHYVIESTDSLETPASWSAVADRGRHLHRG